MRLHNTIGIEIVEERDGHIGLYAVQMADGHQVFKKFGAYAPNSGSLFLDGDLAPSHKTQDGLAIPGDITNRARLLTFADLLPREYEPRLQREPAEAVENPDDDTDHGDDTDPGSDNGDSTDDGDPATDTDNVSSADNDAKKPIDDQSPPA